MNNENNKDMVIILALQQLLEIMLINWDNKTRSKVVSEKIGHVLESIPEFIKYLNEDNLILRHKFFIQFGRYIRYNKFLKGETIQHVCEGDIFFYMIVTGKILKLSIRYKNSYLSLKEYILYLAKLYILNEKNLYNDCIKKNKGVFPIKENIDIVKYASRIKFFDFKSEITKIKNMKNEILLIDNNEKIKKKLNIADILSLYNPDVEIGNKNHFLNNEIKFLVNLPFFYVEKIIEPISFLGHLNKNRGIKKNCCYICLNNCEVFYLDKDNIKNPEDPIYNIVNKKKSEIITNKLLKTHFLFKDTDLNFLSKNYSKYFEIIKIKKNDFIFYQGSPYEGIYFVINGILQLKSNRSYNELSDLNYVILNNLESKDQKQENLDNYNNKKKSNIINKLIHNTLFIKKSNQKNEIKFGTFSINDIIGLNDIYDKKKNIYNFSVLCLSNEAELFFLPKEIFNSLITNQEIYDKIIAMSQEKNKVLSLKITKYKDLFELEFDKFLSPDKDDNKNYNKNNFYRKLYNKNSLENKSIINRLVLKNDKKRLFEEKNNNNKLFKSKSAIDISGDSTIISKRYFHNNKINNINYNIEKNSDIINQNKINFETNNESSNDRVIVFQSQNLQKLNNLSLNKNESQSISLINSKNNPINNNSNNISKTLNNDNITNQNSRTINKLIKSSSSSYLRQNSENGKIKNRINEISNLYINKKAINKELFIPIINDKKIKNINFEINNRNDNYFNKFNKKADNLIEIRPRKNSILISKENYNKPIINSISNSNIFITKDNNNLKKIKFKNLI
jgi:hypothetical protein